MKLDIKVLSKPRFNDIKYLLKEGKLEEYLSEKEKILKEWKSKRYRICSECAKIKLRMDFNGESKYCRLCTKKRRTQSAINRSDYKRLYNKTDKGKLIWHCKQIIYHMKKLGLIIPRNCEICGAIKVQAHHDNYKEPLKVRFLCNKCHREWHKINEPIYE